MTPPPRSRRTEALTTPDELWGALPARQVRSIDAIERIAIAARTLFAERDYETVSVADIAKAAGMSVGAFYTRFPSKEHLVVHLMGGLSHKLVEVMSHEMNPESLSGASVAEVVRRYLTMVAKAFVEHRGLVRPASLIARQTHDVSLQRLMRRFNDEVHGRFRALLLERLPDQSEMTRTRVDIAILWSSAAVREVLLYGEPVSALASKHSALIGELTRTVALALHSE